MAATANKNLKFPLQIDLSTGYFELTQTTLDTIKQNLVMIIASDENERVVKPHIGSRFRSFLFEQNIQVLKFKCENEINRIYF